MPGLRLFRFLCVHGKMGRVGCLIGQYIDPITSYPQTTVILINVVFFDTSCIQKCVSLLSDVTQQTDSLFSLAVNLSSVWPCPIESSSTFSPLSVKFIHFIWKDCTVLFLQVHVSVP